MEQRVLCNSVPNFMQIRNRVALSPMPDFRDERSLVPTAHFYGCIIVAHWVPGNVARPCSTLPLLAWPLPARGWPANDPLCVTGSHSQTIWTGVEKSSQPFWDKLPAVLSRLLRFSWKIKLSFKAAGLPLNLLPWQQHQDRLVCSNALASLFSTRLRLSPPAAFMHEWRSASLVSVWWLGKL